MIEYLLNYELSDINIANTDSVNTDIRLFLFPHLIMHAASFVSVRQRQMQVTYTKPCGGIRHSVKRNGLFLRQHEKT